MPVMAQQSISEGDCATMNCRGMALLGFACAGTIYFCVHQLSVELWKLYDTPRVSVQKKIIDLHIKLMNCNKQQIKLLRKAGIIENFRATMIEIRDTERLFDALEHSRRKRGLQKHPLKTKSDPSERALRVEEKRARRLEERAKPLSLPPCNNSVRLGLANYEAGSGCALDRVSWGVRTLQSQEPFQAGVAEVPTDVPLVVEDAVEVESIGGELCIEVDVNIAGELDPHPNSVSLQRMEHSPSITHCQDLLLGSSSTLQLSTGHRYANFLEPPRSPECFSDASFSHSPRHINRHTSRLSSPAFESSELEERSSTYSFGRSSSASPRRLSATPDRFLLLDSDLESDISENSEVFWIDSLPFSHNKKTKTVCREPPPSLHTVKAQALPLTTSRVNHTYKKPTATKLRHFAKATSPNSTYRQLLLSSQKQEEGTQSTSSLVVSIPLSMLRHSDKPSVVSKPRRVTLSSFATKKRASSRTPSCSSDSSYEPPGLKRVVSATARGRGIARFQSGKSGGIPANRVVTRPRRNTFAGKDMEVEPVNGTQKLRDVMKRHTLLSEGGKRSANLGVAVNGKPSGLQTHKDSLDNGSNSHTEDDQISIASSSTNSTSNSISGRVRTKSTARAGRHVTVTKPTFSFDELFSYYPPKLVVIDDELRPEQTLSVKGLDRHSLPDAHPFLKWTLGQPVRSLTTSRKKRKSYANGNGQKSSGRTQRDQ